MLLTDLFIAGETGASKKIGINNGIFIGNTKVPPGKKISLGGAIAYPGFINSHDHLDFNLFPQLGNRVYANYRDWGEDIQANNRDTINAVLRVPEPVRIRWGMYKNLLSGFTTVVNHGKKLAIEDPFIHVHQDAHSIHSTGFEKNWKWKLNDPLYKSKITAIHTGEGTDELAHTEIDRLLAWNLLSKDLIGIHGVAMDAKQARGFKALVWCPASNYFLLGKTAVIQELIKNTTILFGSDSTLTADWDIWKHFVAVPQKIMLTKEELQNAVTVNAAEKWKLSDRGFISEGKTADLVIVKNSNDGEADTLVPNGTADILMVIQNGNIRMFDESLYTQLTEHLINITHFSKICFNGHYKYVYGDLVKLADETRAYYPEIVLPLNIEPLYV